MRQSISARLYAMFWCDIKCLQSAQLVGNWAMRTDGRCHELAVNHSEKSVKHS